MKKQLIVLLTLTCLMFSYAIETNAAHFKINPKDGIFESDTDFSWIIRNALITYRPSLYFSKEKEDFKKAFTSYIKKNIVLIDEDGKEMEFLKAIEIQDVKHSPQNKFLVTLRRSDIENNTDVNHLKYNTLNTKNKKNTIIPKQNQQESTPSFSFLNYKYYILGTIFLIFLIIITIQEYNA